MIQIKNKVIISDPCYELGTWCMSSQDNMLKGEYDYNVVMQNEGDWGDRVASIEIWHKDYSQPKQWKFKNSNIGVDSGQAGIFAEEIYPTTESTGEYDDEKSFYGQCCNVTLSDKQYGIIDNQGIVSSSGLGDGKYNCYTNFNKDGKCIAIKIKFL